MRNAIRSTIRSRIATGLAASLLGIGAANAQAPGAKAGLLAACPDRNNCVSSDASDPKHAITPFRLKVPPADAWGALKRLIEATPDTRIVQATPDYLNVEFTTGRLRFTDDVEFLLRPEQREIAVRSASRFGYYDFGVNRERVEAVRAKLREKGVVE
jgi:uncharacterized protein (DUF1499 family)